MNDAINKLIAAADHDEELRDALLVNPYDADEITEAMHLGLCMRREERIDRWQSLRERVWTTSASRYCRLFLNHLAEVRPAIRAAS